MYVVFSFCVGALLPLPPPHPTRAHSAAAAVAAAPPKAAAAPIKPAPTPTTAAPVKVENVAAKAGASLLLAVCLFVKDPILIVFVCNGLSCLTPPTGGVLVLCHARKQE